MQFEYNLHILSNLNSSYVMDKYMTIYTFMNFQKK